MGTSADKCHRDRKGRECARVVATASQRQRPAALFSIAVETVRAGLRGTKKKKEKSLHMLRFKYGKAARLTRRKT